MSVQLRDRLSPSLTKLARGIENKKPILEAMGLQLESLTRRAFNEPALRPMPWMNKLTISADGKTFSRSEPSRLRKNQVLVRSIRITSLTNSSVTVGSDRIQAAIHQLGGIIRPKNAPALAFRIGGHLVTAKKVTMPARPFFPFLGGKMIQSAQEKIRLIGEAKIKALTKV
ncbi:phage virion morphogenesis protein [Horticoccus sp. 23ND18S-11]|uniref:phage virion morphogenesis protein n=1 Tax=Horticoccus sp. 23ND18S-11 TaxID=3391832 RepID=UPI0039C99C5F